MFLILSVLVADVCLRVLAWFLLGGRATTPKSFSVKGCKFCGLAWLRVHAERQDVQTGLPCGIDGYNYLRTLRSPGKLQEVEGTHR